MLTCAFRFAYYSIELLIKFVKACRPWGIGSHGVPLYCKMRTSSLNTPAFSLPSLFRIQAFFLICVGFFESRFRRLWVCSKLSVLSGFCNTLGVCPSLAWKSRLAVIILAHLSQRAHTTKVRPTPSDTYSLLFTCVQEYVHPSPCTYLAKNCCGTVQ